MYWTKRKPGIVRNAIKFVKTLSNPVLFCIFTLYGSPNPFWNSWKLCFSSTVQTVVARLLRFKSLTCRRMRTKRTSLFQMLFTYISLRSPSHEEGKGSLGCSSEGSSHPIIQKVRTCTSEFDLVQLELFLIENFADFISRVNREQKLEVFWTKNKNNDIFAVVGLLPKHRLKERVSIQRCTAAKNVSTLTLVK